MFDISIDVSSTCLSLLVDLKFSVVLDSLVWSWDGLVCPVEYMHHEWFFCSVIMD